MFSRGETKKNRAGALRPMVLGDERMAFRLHSFFMSDDSFALFDIQGLFERQYEPNIIILFGPVNEIFEERLAEIRSKLYSHKLVYVEELFSPDEEEAALETGKRIGADFFLAKEYITMKSLREVPDQ